MGYIFRSDLCQEQSLKDMQDVIIILSYARNILWDVRHYVKEIPVSISRSCNGLPEIKVKI